MSTKAKRHNANVGTMNPLSEEEESFIVANDTTEQEPLDEANGEPSKTSPRDV